MEKTKILMKYDYDKTLARSDSMSSPIFQGVLATEKGRDEVYKFYGSEGYRKYPLNNMENFWALMDTFRPNNKIESRVLTHIELLKYLYSKGMIDVSNAGLRKFATDDDYFMGMPAFFQAMEDEFGKFVDFKHAVITSGLEEVLRGNAFGELEKQGKIQIYGSKFIWGIRDGKEEIIQIDPIEPSMKVGIISRLMKGENYSGDDAVPRSEYGIPKGNIISFQDSKSDAPPAAFVRDEGGYPMLVHDPEKPQLKEKLEQDMNGRYYAIVPADYRVGSQLWDKSSEAISSMITKKNKRLGNRIW